MAWEGAWNEAQANIPIAARLAAEKRDKGGKLFAIGHLILAATASDNQFQNS